MKEDEKKFYSSLIGTEIPEQYEKYFLTVINGKFYYSWQSINDKLISNSKFNWNNYFELPDKINFRSTYRKTGKIIDDKIGNRAISYSETENTGYQRPVFRFISLHISSDEYDEYLNRYNLKIGEEIEFTQMPLISSYRDSLLYQMSRQAVEINKLNQQIADVLKVYYFETEHANNGQINDHIRCIERIFSVLKGGISKKRLQETWIFEAIRSNSDITDHLKEATIYGISHLSEKKDPLLNIAQKLAKEIYVLESVIEDKFLNNKVTSLQLNEDPKVEKIISLAIDGRKVKRINKKHAKEFMRAYASIKGENVEHSIEGYITEVGMTQVSTNSYRLWIEKFDEAEQMLLKD